MTDLQECRKEIDVIDKEILRLFEKRMKVCEDVAEYKIHTGKKVLDPKREQDKIEVLKESAHGEFNELGAQELFQQIMAISRKRQYQLLTKNGVENDTKDYKFVKVDKDYKVGDDIAYTNKDGDEFIAYTMIGAVQKNVGSVNEDFSFTNDIITNKIITVTKSGNNISDYNDLSGKKLAVVTDIAKVALDKNSTIKNNNKNTLYPTIEDALSALDNGSVDAVITDEFNFSPLKNAEKYQVLNGELDKISYAFMFKKGDWVVDNWNEAIYELKSPDYNDKDEFTPMVEKYFGYNASSFDYVPSKTK